MSGLSAQFAALDPAVSAQRGRELIAACVAGLRDGRVQPEEVWRTLVFLQTTSGPRCDGARLFVEELARAVAEGGKA